MDSLFLLIPVTLLLLLVAIAGFFWAVNNDQFDDLESPATRILFDDDEQATLDEIRNANTLSSKESPKTKK